MKGAIMQPYFFPYIGYYQLAYEVEKFVFLDDVNYIKKGYINRNSLLINGARHNFSIPISKISQNRTIRMHEYTGDFSSFIKLVEQNYKKAPYFQIIMPLVERVVSDPNNNVAYKNAKSIISIFDYLGISRDFVFSSSIEIKKNLKGEDRIISICKKLDFNKYRNAIGGQNLYNRNTFNTENIDLKFIQHNTQPYPQGKHDFVSNLSIIDALMHCDKQNIINLLKTYKLL